MSSLGLRGLAALAWLGCFPGSAAAQCSAWPGEPEPLPQLGGGDEFLERWTRLRRDELRGLALLLETSDPVEAHRLWLHTACLAPGDTEIAAGLARSAPAVVRRIAVEVGDAPRAAGRSTLGAAFGALKSGVRIPPPVVRDPALEGFDFQPVDEQIEAASAHLRQARFHSAADLADLSRARLAKLSAAPVVRERRARIELVAATAQVALGDVDEARSCLKRALDADPDFRLDPSSAPPKLLRLLDEARDTGRGEP